MAGKMNSDKEELVFWRMSPERLDMQLALRNLVARRKQVLNVALLLHLLVSQRNDITIPRSIRSSSVEQKYWLVEQGMKYLFRSKVQENLLSIQVDFQFHFEPY